MDNVEEEIRKDILESIHDYVGEFSYHHDDENDTLTVTEYTEEGEILRRHKVTLFVKVEELG